MYFFARFGRRVIPTPWHEVNESFSGGLRRGRMVIIGARPGEGKSVAAHQLAEHAAADGHPSVIFSVEMGRLEVAGRIVSNGATVERGEITRRDLSETRGTSSRLPGPRAGLPADHRRTPRLDAGLHRRAVPRAQTVPRAAERPCCRICASPAASSRTPTPCCS
ncbi:DnaB-like helicase C-terminal domain-containing protein [Amycolatopsis sp. WAC 04182]|uniref:DnaB-like helicase C-terminal domain-containing protein n=1 Tax=Amycolatopsis sp. WAC 04182 TaxID=2203198 RepID=UPI000F788659